MKETSYQGYKIRTHRTGQWFAHIYRPGENKMMGNIPTASFEEGEAVLLKRAHEIIDGEEAKATAAKTSAKRPEEEK